jgi:hypothetical protein
MEDLEGFCYFLPKSKVVDSGDLDCFVPRNDWHKKKLTKPNFSLKSILILILYDAIAFVSTEEIQIGVRL